MLLSGRKRWYMQSGERFPLPAFPADLLPVHRYDSELFDRLDAGDRPLHCVQQPGDLVYVPEGWCESDMP